MGDTLTAEAPVHAYECPFIPFLELQDRPPTKEFIFAMGTVADYVHLDMEADTVCFYYRHRS